MSEEKIVCPSGWPVKTLEECPREYPGCNCVLVLSLNKPGDIDYEIVAEWAGIKNKTIGATVFVVQTYQELVGVFSSRESAEECIRMGLLTKRFIKDYEPHIYAYMLDDMGE